MRSRDWQVPTSRDDIVRSTSGGRCMTEQHISDTGARPSDSPAEPLLAGLRVLDLTTALSGPWATLTLAGLGADVVKVEPPGGRDNARGNPPFLGPDGLHFGAPSDEDVSVTVMNRHRDKKSVTLDLKSDRGRKIFHDLVSWADVLVENYSDGVTKRLGIDYETLRAVNPRLIYCSITGFGDGSPYKHIKAMDIVIQAMSGIVEVTGFEDGPPTRVGLPLADMIAPLYAVIGILGAVVNRQQTGVGQRIEVSMIDALATLVAEEHFDVLHAAGMPYRSGNHLPRLAPFGVYPTSDGHVAITGLVDDWAHALFRAMGAEEMMTDPAFATRGARAANSYVLNDAIEKWTSKHTTDHVVSLLAESAVPAVPVRTPREVVDDPYLRARESVVPLQHPDADLRHQELMGSGIPIQFSGAGRIVPGRPSHVGADTETVLKSIARLSDADLQLLREEGIV
ncbi:CoA transferase [Saccharomonospora sp. NPDC046836]|uniref:CaiB/BaiF CoA transferase family protein n=1 Tax=Saccharomonospora sp. NPDC046836 TaxID=3156921 RepID=UPI0034056B6C